VIFQYRFRPGGYVFQRLMAYDSFALQATNAIRALDCVRAAPVGE